MGDSIQGTNDGVAKIPVADKFSPFNITTHTYKTVHDHPILVDVFVPKRLLNASTSSRAQDSNKRPVFVRIHGGWLVGGQRNHASWCPLYTLELAFQDNAIVVMPDYRLIPESSGHDILEDVDEFWAWVSKGGHEGLQDAVRSSTDGRFEADLDRVLVEGESAGGYLSIQLVLSHHRVLFPRIRVMIAAYPMLGLRAPHWTQAYHEPMFDMPELPASVLEEHLESTRKELEQGRIPVKTNEPMEYLPRGDLAIAVVQNGRFLDLLDPEHKDNPGGAKGRRLHPEERFQDDVTLTLPASFFLHGADDSAVPIAGTDAFLEMVKARDGDGRVIYVRPPGDHGFDTGMSLYDGDPGKAWLREGAALVENAWLR